MKIILTFKDRPNYLRMTLAVLKEVLPDWPDVQLLLYNDGSEKPIPKIVKTMPQTCYIERDKSLGPYKSGGAAIAEVFLNTKESHVLVIDSDCLLHPRALGAVDVMINQIPDLGIGSLFNSDRHKAIKRSGNYLQKESVGGLGVVIKREPWLWYNEQVMQHGEKHKGWDWDMCMWFKESKGLYNIYSTERSYIEHFGQSGAHSGPACIIDRAIRFVEDREYEM